MEGGSSGNNSHAQTSDSSVKLMEIKIKTLDSRVYSCNVDQDISVPSLKEHIAALTGVPVENQRLICRGKVLKDDHNLSAYNVEDGHTLHLVTRQVPQPAPPPSSSAGVNAGEEEQGGDDPSTAASRRPTQISHSVVMGTFNVPDNGDGGLPDVNRIISSVLSSLGIGNLAPNAGANVGGPGVNPVGTAPAVSGQDMGAGSSRQQSLANGNQPSPLDRGVAQATWPTAGQQIRLLQQAVVIPDALTTISQYLDGLDQALANNGQHVSSPDAPPLNLAPSQPPATIRGHPTPANLGAVIRRTMGLITGQAGVELDRLASQLENELNISDVGNRSELQSAALRDGVLLQHLGALLLELGRATLTLRMGTTAMESAVNAGPAVFISPAGPNPMMVQPLPFQPGAGFGTTNIGTQPTAGTMGFGEVPRNVSIHIHANDSIPGFPAPAQGLAPGNVPPQGSVAPPSMGPTSGPSPIPAGGITPSVHGTAVPIQASSTSATTEHLGIRVLPMRTVVAAVPSRPLIDNTGVPSNLLHPLLARFQQLNYQQVSGAPAVVIQGTPPSSAQLPVPAGMPQQSSNSIAPTIRAQVQVQAWVPDGQGGSRLVSNEEALRTLFMQTTQAASLSTSQQLPTEVNGTVAQANTLAETSNTVHPAAVQQVVSDVHDEPADPRGEQVHRDLLNDMEVDKTNTTEVKEQATNEHVEVTTARDDSSTDIEMQPKDQNTTPAGLGLRGLQPLPSRTPKRSARQHQQSTQAAGIPEQTIQNQNVPSTFEPVSMAQAQCNTQGPQDSSRNVPSQMPPAVFQLLSNMPSRRGGGGNMDIASLISQLTANGGGAPASARGRDAEQGSGLPAGALGNLMGQVMQNPFMRNVMQQVVEQVGNGAIEQEDLMPQGVPAQSASPQGGLDFSRLLQEMMPVVSQAINRVSTAAGSEQPSSPFQGMGTPNGVVRGTTEGVQEGPVGLQDMLSNGSNLSTIFQQMMPVVAQAFGGALNNRPELPSSNPPIDGSLRSDREDAGAVGGDADEVDEDGQRTERSLLGDATSSERIESLPVAKRQKIEVEKALEMLEQGSSPDEILRVIAELASMWITSTNNQDGDVSLLAQHLCQDDDLVHDYMALLLSDLTPRNQTDS